MAERQKDDSILIDDIKPSTTGNSPTAGWKDR